MVQAQVFLGGTCGQNRWRPDFIAHLSAAGVSPSILFDPVVPEWSDEAKAREDMVKATARYVMFHLGNPMELHRSPHSMYSLVQVVQSAFKVDRTTRVFFDLTPLDARAAKSIKAIAGDLEKRFAGTVVTSWQDLVENVATLWKQKKDIRVFLGGTCGNNMWRTRFLEQLAARGVDTENFYNPMISEHGWGPDTQKLEDQMRSQCDCEVYYIGDPMETRGEQEQISTYSIVEALFALYSDLERAIICFDYSGWGGQAYLTMKKFEADIRRDFPSAKIFSSLAEAENWLIGEFGNSKMAA